MAMGKRMNRTEWKLEERTLKAQCQLGTDGVKSKPSSETHKDIPSRETKEQKIILYFKGVKTRTDKMNHYQPFI
jgi:hypothetical protein